MNVIASRSAGRADDRCAQRDTSEAIRRPRRVDSSAQLHGTEHDTSNYRGHGTEAYQGMLSDIGTATQVATKGSNMARHSVNVRI